MLLDRASQTVVKAPHRTGNEDALEVEKRIYERIGEHGGHKGLLRYHGPCETGIRLEFVSNSSLKYFFAKPPPKDVDVETLRLRWVRQIADALRFVHSLSIIHGDLTCANIFLDDHYDARVGDFGGSSLDGSPLLVAVTSSHAYPGELLSVQADIFALGSTWYEIMTGFAPYHELAEHEIDARYLKADFAETKALGPMGDIIKNCWQGHYKSVDNIVTDMDGMCESDDI